VPLALPNGCTLRPATPDDADEVAAMLLADDLADVGRSHYDVHFVREQWATPGFDLSTDAWMMVAPDGTAVGHTNVMPDGETRAKAWGVVHPEHRGLGIGSALVELTERRTGIRLQGVPNAVLHQAINDTDEAAATLMRSRGYRLGRSFRHMQIDLAERPEDTGAAPAGIAIRRIVPERDLRAIHRIFVEAFRQEWGYRVVPFEEWSALEVEAQSYDPTLWHLATERDRPVGAITGTVMGNLGWIGELGVRPPWRSRGIGSALLHRSFATFAARGLERVRLNVDAENPMGATRLYERVGMRIVRGWDVYEKPLA
jgi:ribosomal protein S18 acetylase RimI-like enzyme